MYSGALRHCQKLNHNFHNWVSVVLVLRKYKNEIRHNSIFPAENYFYILWFEQVFFQAVLLKLFMYDQKVFNLLILWSLKKIQNNILSVTKFTIFALSNILKPDGHD